MKLLTRVKTFVATGLATAGRLYAGDLNAIQDAVAAQSDYAQRIDAGTYGIGEVALALLRYGSGEARLTGAYRTDGIVRALGGLYAGQFTTSARDAIAAGANLTPYGLMIFNTTTNRLEINKGNDTTRNWQPLGGLNVSQSGTLKGNEGGINLIPGSGVTMTIADNPGTGNVDITINAPPAAVAGIIPIGGIILYGVSADPINYLLCDGRSLVRVSPYDQLFAVIGTTFGAADGSHFNIPDLRGRVPVGVNTKVPLATNEGVTVNARNVSHNHFLSQLPQQEFGLYTSTPGAGLNHLITGVTSGDAANQDSPAFLGIQFAIRYQ